MRQRSDATAAGSLAAGDPVIISHAILGVTNNRAGTFVWRGGDDPKTVADAAVDRPQHCATRRQNASLAATAGQPAMLGLMM